jgi:3D (Asp-Asp-Asp) domain-containing protein
MRLRFVAVLVLYILLLALTAEATPRRKPAPARSRVFTANAYCLHGQTQSGLRPRRGTIAADPRVLPIGLTVRIAGGKDVRRGIYTVLDTGGRVKGRRVDIYMPKCREARAFGVQRVRVATLHRGTGAPTSIASR